MFLIFRLYLSGIGSWKCSGGNEGHGSEQDDPGEEAAVVWPHTKKEKGPHDEETFKDGGWGEEGEEDPEEMDGLCEWWLKEKRVRARGAADR